MNVLARTPLRVRHETRRRLLQVVRVEQPTPRMRRIVLGGDALDGFTSAAADDHVKLFFPAPGNLAAVFPDGGPVRDYTPRRFDPVARELTLEFVLHGDGPASSWAARATPGQWLGVAGPRGSMLIPEDYAAYLLAGDETALPAIARRLEEMHPGTRALALIEVADAAEERRLPTAANAEIVWLHRGKAEPGATRLLDQALRDARLPAGDLHAWLAGEIDTVRRLRAALIERGVGRADIKAAGYWRLGHADSHGTVED